MNSKTGSVLGTIEIALNYEIIEHFSKHLYSSPNKAVEELVVNGYDAGAQRVHVWITGGVVKDDFMIIWDDGQAMDLEGLRRLWDIAKSPKEGTSREVFVGRQNRKVIGKFGIGKLASYTIGDRISHLCKRDGEYFHIQVDYNLVKDALTDDNSERAFAQENVYGLSESEAKDLLQDMFSEIPECFDDMFDSDSWTVAYVSKLKTHLKAGRLKWLLGNAMPLRPDFKVCLNDEEVHQEHVSFVVTSEWSIGGLNEQMEEKWNASGLAGTLVFGEEKGLDPSKPNEMRTYVEFPSLGKVWGQYRLYDKTLKSKTGGRQYGFFVLVRGRLINIDDPKMFLSEPSFGTFYYSCYYIHADRLDSALLASRDEIQKDTKIAEELSFLQRFVYGVVRKTVSVNSLKEQEITEQPYRVPTKSNEFFRKPVQAIMRDASVGFDDRKYSVVRDSLGVDLPLCVLTPGEQNKFKVNVDHPLYEKITKRLGTSQAAKRAMEEIDSLAVSDVLLHGYMLGSGLEESIVKVIMRWRDDQLRQLADVDARDFAEIEEALKIASVVGRDEFELEIVRAFKEMGFYAEKVGKAGNEDGVVMFPSLEWSNESRWKFIFEAKGSMSAVSNAKACVGSAASHRNNVSAKHAVIVAREFTGFGKDVRNDAAILQECRAVGNVSIVQIDALIEMLRLVYRFGYKVDNAAIQEVLTIVEAPVDKMERVKSIFGLVGGFKWGRVLNIVWDYQEKYSNPMPIDLLHMEMQKHEDFYDVDDDMIELKFVALQEVSEGGVSVDRSKRRVVLNRSPHMLISNIRSALSNGAQVSLLDVE